MVHRPASVFVVALTLLVPLRALPTTMLALGTEDLFRRADVVAVLDVASSATRRAGGRLITHVQAVVRESFKGEPAGTAVEIMVPGGTEGRWSQRAEGTPAFSPGETCVAFLKQVAPGHYHVTGMEQGKLSLSLGSDGTWWVHRTSTARIVERGVDGTLEEATPLPATEPAEGYFAQLRALARAGR